MLNMLRRGVAAGAPTLPVDLYGKETLLRPSETYRQIRDAELDREQGKLSKEDWARVDADLRREAIAVLKKIDALD